MNKSYFSFKKFEDYTKSEVIVFLLNTLSFVSVIYLIARFVSIAFYLNHYELLHIDERIIINDIYNVWNLDNEFNRYPKIDNPVIKNIFLIITELSYGGDLRYGRIWSNIFIFLMGPFSLFGDSVLITSVRIFTIIFYFISMNILINLFLNKKLRWFYLLAFYSLPGVLYFNSVPKPDPFVIFFISLGLLYLKKEKYYLSIGIFAIATGVKIVGVFGLVLAIFYLFTTKKISLNQRNISKAILSIWLGVVVANPVLILPPIRIYNLPNFYAIYYKWIDSQSLYDQEARFSLEYFNKWVETLSIHFSYNLTRSPIFFYFGLFLIIFLLYLLFKKKEHMLTLVTLIGLTHLIFIIISVQRQWILYLNYSFIFILIGIFYYLNKYSKNKYLVQLIFLMILVPNGFIKINSSIDAKSPYPSEDINNIPEVIQEIETLYKTRSENYNLVFWDPSFGMPRNKVTYNSFFDVRENWEGHELDYILENSDFYVTKNEIKSERYNSYKVQDYFIYSRSD